ncbi:MerR family transcriptional regulator [Ruegeria marina]|uniref:MerR family transcriptional regulator n=1 Tax=Ruegeria marina TaxID=639004 RepID=UPI001FDF4CD5
MLRFWESKFSQVKPVKRAGGRRYYRPADMLLLGGIKKLLHDDGMTIKGVQKLLREQGVLHVSEFSQGLEDTAVSNLEDGGNVVRFNAAKLADSSPAQFSMDLGDRNVLNDLFPDLVSDRAATGEDDLSGSTGDDGDDDDDDAIEIVNLSPPSAAGKEFSAETEATVPAVSEESKGENTDEDMDTAPGILSAVAQTTALPAKMAMEIAPLATQLKDWLSRQAS